MNEERTSSNYRGGSAGKAGRQPDVYCEGKLKLNRWKTKAGEPRANLQIAASCVLALDSMGKCKRPSPLKAKEGETSGELSAAAQEPSADHQPDALIPF